MSNIFFSGSLSEFEALSIHTESPGQGYIYAFFFNNGMAKIGSSRNPHQRLEHLLQTLKRAGYSDVVHQVVLSIPVVEFIQQELELHKTLPQEQRSFEYFKITCDEYAATLGRRRLKTEYSAAEVEQRQARRRKADALMDSLTAPLRAGLDRRQQMDEFSFGPKSGAALRLLSKAVQLAEPDDYQQLLDFAERLIDGLSDSEAKEDVSALFCAVQFAINCGFHEEAQRLSAN